MSAAAIRPRWQRWAASGLALIALTMVFSRLEPWRLTQLWKQADAVLLLPSLSMGMLVVASAGIRWRVLVAASGLHQASRWADLLDYWRSLGVGLVGPGSLGSDVFRVVTAGRRSGRFGAAALVVLIEKAGALAACALMAAAALPWAATNGLRIGGIPVQVLLAVVIGTSLLAAMVLPVLARSPLTARALAALRWRVAVWTQTLAQHGEAQAQQPMPAPLGIVHAPTTLLHSPAPAGTALRLRTLALLLLWSWLAMGLSALQSQFFFTALGFPVPLQANLFVTPLLFMVLSLPLTPGGVGVRELSFVAFYGALGVPVEVALVVSFCALASQLLSQGVGALMLLRADGLMERLKGLTKTRN